MRKYRASGLLSVVMLAVIFSPNAAASQKSFSVKIARGHVATMEPTSRIGLEIDFLHSASNVLGLGLGCGWWEELGEREFTRPYDAAHHLDARHQRELFATALLGLRGRIGASRPYMLISMGGYAINYRDRHGNSSESRTKYAPGLSAGVGVAGATKPSLAFQGRWHRVFANSDPFDSRANFTDFFVLSVGLSFN